MADLLVRIDGATDPVPLRDCFWVLATPDGCATVSLVGREAATAEAAHIQATPRVLERDRQTRDGWRVDLYSRDQWREHVRPCFAGTCQHRAGA